MFSHRETRLVLGFDANCLPCLRIAEEVSLISHGRLEVVSLVSEQMVEWRAGAFGSNPPWTPTLIEITGGKVRAHTGAGVSLALVQKLGVTDSWRVAQAIGELRREGAACDHGPLFGLTRSGFLTGAIGAIVGVAILVGTGTETAKASTRNQYRLAPGDGYNLTDTYVRGSETLLVYADRGRWAAYGSSTIMGIGSKLNELAIKYGATCFNGGKGGEWSTHVAARLGAVPARLSVVGGVIPASGGVAVTASNVAPNAGMRAFDGTLAGVAGLLSSTGTTLTFTRAVAGSVKAVAADTPFLSTLGATHRGRTFLLNMGKNDFDAAVPGRETQVIANTGAVVDWLSPLYKRVLVLGHFADGGLSAGSAERGQILATNAAYLARYGTAYIDMYGFVTGPDIWDYSGVTPTQADHDAQALGNKPPSVSADSQHFNAAGYTAVVRYIEERMHLLDWYETPAGAATRLALPDSVSSTERPVPAALKTAANLDIRLTGASFGNVSLASLKFLSRSSATAALSSWSVTSVSGGKIRFNVFTDAHPTGVVYESSVALPAPNDIRGLRMRFIAATKTVQFFTSTPAAPATWTQLGLDVVKTSDSTLRVVDTPFVLGARTAPGITGLFDRIEILDEAGVVLLSRDFTTASAEDANWAYTSGAQLV